MDGKAKILVVDDDESIRKVLAITLEEEGYVVDTAENGKDAMEKTNAKFYNMALIDIRLPDMEGTRLLSSMKKTTPKMIKIIMTGYPSQQSAIEAVNRGADSYILKPLDMNNLLCTIQERLKEQQESKRYSQEKVTEFIETRVKELEHGMAARHTGTH